MDSRDVTNKALCDFHRDVAEAFGTQSDAEIQAAWREMNKEALKPARKTLDAMLWGAVLWIAIAWLWWQIFDQLSQ